MTTLLTPVEINDVSYAFPADALDYMPKMKDLPEEFQERRSPWCEFADTWFGFGLSNRTSFTPAEVNGETIDPAKAWRQLSAIMRSFAPKHEHKIAATGYLASIWMKELLYGRTDASDGQLVALGGGTVEEWLDVLAEKAALEAEQADA